MGNIRPSFVKIRAIKLCEEYPDKFGADFEENKKLVEQFTDLRGEDGKLANKRIRNWIAGYITTYKQRRVD